MKRRKLGSLEVSCIGLGCMSMTPIYGDPDPNEAIATIHRKWLEQNVKAAALAVSPATLAALDRAFPKGAAAGTRYPEPQMKRVGV